MSVHSRSFHCKGQHILIYICMYKYLFIYLFFLSGLCSRWIKSCGNVCVKLHLHVCDKTESCLLELHVLHNPLDAVHVQLSGVEKNQDLLLVNVFILFNKWITFKSKVLVLLSKVWWADVKSCRSELLILLIGFNEYCIEQHNFLHKAIIEAFIGMTTINKLFDCKYQWKSISVKPSEAFPQSVAYQNIYTRPKRG